MIALFIYAGFTFGVYQLVYWLSYHLTNTLGGGNSEEFNKSSAFASVALVMQTAVITLLTIYNPLDITITIGTLR